MRHVTACFSILAALATSTVGCLGSSPVQGTSSTSSETTGSSTTGSGTAGTAGTGGATGTGGSTSSVGGAATTSTSTGTTSTSTTSASTGSGGPPGGTEYAPYFYTWGWGNAAYPFTSLVDLKAKSGLAGITLAFVLSDGGCAPSQDIQQHLDDVNAFRAAGGKVKASFGGANGTYLENACPDAASLAAAIGAFVDQTGITDLDFDVEQYGAMNDGVNLLRAQAFKLAQDQKGIQVSFTLPADPRDKWDTPGGVPAASLDVVKTVLAAGVTISHMNLMTMDYGGYYSDGKAMGDLAVSALTDAKAQLQSVIPGLGDAAAWRMLGATPMIGQNDVTTEVFSVADAQILAGFAKQNQLGLVAFWAINRDQPGSGDLGLYSEAESSTFAFHQVFQTVTQ
jgi:chitinase